MSKNNARKAIKRKLKESLPKHIEEVQQTLFQIHVEFKDGNELAQTTSEMCLVTLELTEILLASLDEINKTI